MGYDPPKKKKAALCPLSQPVDRMHVRFIRSCRVAVLAYLNVRRSALLVSVAPPATAEAEVREHVAKRVRAAAALGAFKAFLSKFVVGIPSNRISSGYSQSERDGCRCIDGELISCIYISGINIDKRDCNEEQCLVMCGQAKSIYQRAA